MRYGLPFMFNFDSRENSGQSNVRRRQRCQSPYLLALAVLTAHCLLAANPSLTGTVADDTGHPIPGARVLISYAPSINLAVPAPPVIAGPLAAMVTADATGAFHVDTLPPAQYIACAETAAPGYLDPCHWSPSAPAFTVTAGQTTSGVNIVMPKGSVLRVHVDDPQQLLKPVTGPVDLDFEIHIVTRKGIHYSAPIQSSTALARDHAITIPFDSPLSLRILSAHVTVSDSSGKAFASAGTTVSAPPGATPAVIGVTVTGKK
jgi:hypothetical protein